MDIMYNINKRNMNGGVFMPKRGNRFIIVVFLLLFLLTTGLADESMFQESKPEGEGEPRVSLLFQGDDLQTVLGEITLQTGVNLVVDPSVTGIVTIDVMDATIEEVLNIILKPRNMYYTKTDDYYFICLADPNADGFMKISETALLDLKNIAPQKVMNLLPDYYAKFIKADTESNTIAITAPEEIINNIVKFINSVDKSKGQLRISVTAVEIAKELVNSKSPFEFSLNIPESIGKATEGFDAILSWGYEEGEPFTFNAEIFDVLQAQMQILEKNHLAKIETDPSILVKDRETATLFVGETRNIIYEDSEGNKLTETIETGVRLEVTPTVYPEFIQLKLTPNISQFGKQDTDGYVVYNNEVTSTINVKPGQTAVLAGITINESKTNNMFIPGLGQLPILRFFFSDEEEIKGEKELLIFVTPEIDRGDECL